MLQTMPPEIEKYIELVVNSDFDSLIKIARKNQLLIPDKYLISDNIENLETGISGYLLVLLEYCRNNQDERYFGKLLSLTNELVAYCKQHTTENFSLFTGRGGLVYLLLKLYELTGYQYLLQESLELITLAGQDYLMSDYTPDYLYNGRAGTLLLLIDLYQLSQSEVILDLVNRFTLKINQNAFADENGISWKSKEEINLQNSCGFATGTAGIVYVFKKLNNCFPTPAIQYCINNAEKYIQSSWNGHAQNWFLYERDIVNVKTLMIYCDQLHQNSAPMFLPEASLSWGNGKAGIQLAVKEPSIQWDTSFEDMSLNIYDGIAGIGLCLLKDRKRNSTTLSKIVNRIKSNLANDSLDGGLLFGAGGKYIFLLSYFSNYDACGNIAFPGIKQQAVFEKLGIELQDVRKFFLSRFYSRTIAVLANITEGIINPFLSRCEISNVATDILDFEQLIEDHLKENINMPAVQLLQDVYALETKKLKYSRSKTKTNLQLYLESFLHRRQISSVLNNSEDWILNQPIRISERVQIAGTRWNWSGDVDFSNWERLYDKRGSYEYIFLSSCEEEVAEYSLQTDGLVLHRFDQQKSINQAIMEIKFFCKSQPKQVIEAFIVNTGSKDVDDFISRIDFLVNHKVRQLLFDGILEFTS